MIIGASRCTLGTFNVPECRHGLVAELVVSFPIPATRIAASGKC